MENDEYEIEAEYFYEDQIISYHFKSSHLKSKIWLIRGNAISIRERKEATRIN